jgi:hypothetical protein
VARPGGGQVTPSPAELASLDPIWDGVMPPGDRPAWCHQVGTLVAVARAPALPDELAREADVLAAMERMLAVPPRRPPRARFRLWLRARRQGRR